MKKDSATGGKAERIRPSGGEGRSAQTGPVVGDENGIAGIGSIVLDAGRLGRHEPFQANLAFKGGEVLRRLIGDGGGQGTVGRQRGREPVWKRGGGCCERT